MTQLPVREMIERLVAIPSVSAVDPALDMGNASLSDELANWLEHEGFEVERMEVGGDPKKVNLIATRGRGPGGLVLSGHTDTVPFDEPLWSSDAFVATPRDDRLYGLGTADMKSFLALAIAAARSFSDDDLSEPLIILATADEESGMAGARALVEAGRPKARRAVIGEPTGLVPIRMQKGAALERLELIGRSGHSSDPRFGNNALLGMHRAIAAMLAVSSELAERHQHPHLSPPEPTMNLGRIEGGDNPNRICGRCQLDYDLRLVPGMSYETVLPELRARIDAALDGQGLAVEHRSLVQPIPPFETPADAALVRAVEELTGHSAAGVSFGTEAPFLQALGMETVVLGPGSIDVAHQPDEYLPLAHIDPAIALLRRLIARSCTSERDA